MQILVIGGTGFIGPRVVKYLSLMGHKITIFHTGAHEADLPLEVQHVHSNLAKIPVSGIPDELKRLIPDIVLHMVPVGEADSRIVMDEFRGIAKRIIAISSMDVYLAYGRIHGSEPGPIVPIPLDEDAPLRSKLYPYQRDTSRSEDAPDRYLDDYEKILTEKAITAYQDLPGTVLRFPMVYGPGDRAQRLFKYVKRMSDNRPTILLKYEEAQWRGPRGYVDNVAYAVALATVDNRASGKIYNVAEVSAFTEAEWVAQIGKSMGWSGEIIVTPENDHDERWSSYQDWILNTSRIRRELGYTEPVAQVESIKQTAEWELANPPNQIDPAQFDYKREDAILSELRTR